MDKELQALNKLEAMLEDSDFTEEEIKVLKRVATMVRGFDALGSFAGFIRSVIVWIGVVVGGLVALKAGFVDWILSIVGQR
jgi:hypothetical protein